MKSKKQKNSKISDAPPLNKYHTVGSEHHPEKVINKIIYTQFSLLIGQSTIAQTKIK
jgi:hypothetical protein